MTSPTKLEIAGTLGEHSLAELLIEISSAKLNGSLRASNALTQQKIVVYFDAGDIVFAVSNARRFRLFEMLVGENKFSNEQIAAISDFTNDLALVENLEKNEILTRAEIAALVARQIELILKDAFAWREQAGGGEWVFSPLVRIKGDIRFAVDAPALLIEHARNLPDEEIAAKFGNLRETLSVKTDARVSVNLLPEEAFVLSRFEQSQLDVEKVTNLSGLPIGATLRIIYSLWLGGFLERGVWNTPFSARALEAIRTVNVSLKKPDAAQSAFSAAKSAPPNPVENEKNNRSKREPISPSNLPPPQNQEPQSPLLTLDAYLEQTENAENYYDIFKVSADAPASDIKSAYFALAKRFHPDLFQREVAADRHRQIQNAFTKIAQAYEALKNEQSREVYDYKMRKELAQMKPAKKDDGVEVSPEEVNLQFKTDRAAHDFENGFNFLMEENFDDALPFLARAAHLIPNNARYRAYYGKALSATDASQKHKAEAEMQAALKLDPNNADFRLLLAEFFVQMNLPKRAEGELNRLLAIFPSNRGARLLLDNLAKKQ